MRRRSAKAAFCANTMEELFDYAWPFAYQPLIGGNRLAIVTNAGGPGIIATDAAERSGLALARFTPETIALFQRDLPPAASVFNPIDVIGDAHAIAIVWHWRRHWPTRMWMLR